MTYLEFKDEKSSKFWQVEQDDSALIISYGKIGTEGKTIEKEFDDEEEAKIERDKLIKAKIKKGYIYSNGGDSESNESATHIFDEEISEELKSFIEDDDLESFIEIINTKELANAILDDDGEGGNTFTILHHACMGEYPRIIAYLLKLGAKPDPIGSHEEFEEDIKPIDVFLEFNEYVDRELLRVNFGDFLNGISLGNYKKERYDNPNEAAGHVLFGYGFVDVNTKECDMQRLLSLSKDYDVSVQIVKFGDVDDEVEKTIVIGVPIVSAYANDEVPSVFGFKEIESAKKEIDSLPQDFFGRMEELIGDSVNKSPEMIQVCNGPLSASSLGFGKVVLGDIEDLDCWGRNDCQENWWFGVEGEKVSYVEMEGPSINCIDQNDLMKFKNLDGEFCLTVIYD